MEIVEPLAGACLVGDDLSKSMGKRSDLAVTAPIEGPRLMEQEPLNAPPAVAARSRRVLIVDDNRDAAKCLSMLLEMEGYAVTVAFDGPSALEAVRTNAPDVVLLDIGLPGMDGLEVARRLRQGPCPNNALLVAFTGRGLEEDFQRSREAGFNAHLVKPIKLETLNKLILSAELSIQDGVPAPKE